MTARTERILEEMDRRGISDRKLRKAVSEVKGVHAGKMKEYDEKLETLGERNSYSNSVMDAERNGRRLSPPTDVPPAARKRVPKSAASVSQA